MEPQEAPDKKQELTASGRRKKPDKWANMLRAKTLAFDTLSKTAAQLEAERNRLRDKEFLLVQVLETLQALVVDAVSSQAAVAVGPTSTAPAHACPLRDNNNTAPQTASCAAVQAAAAGPAQAAACQHAGRPPVPPAAAAVAVAAAATSTACPASQQYADGNSLLWTVVLEAVREREDEISRMYGLLASSVGPHPRSTSMQQQMQELLKALCSPENVPKVGTMTAPQLTARLSLLAGQIALQLIAVNTPHPVDEPALATISGNLHETYLEYATPLMTALVWHSERFSTVVHTNLDTQERFLEPLSKQHWLKALHQLKLTEQQLHVLCCMYRRYQESIKQIAAALERNTQQQVSHNVCVVNLLQQEGQQQVAPAAPAAGAAGQWGSSYEGAAAAAVAAGSGGADATACPLMGCGSSPYSGPTHTPPQAQMEQQQQQVSAEALVEEQHRLMRQWRLLGLHFGIVTVCTLSTYQQALFVTGCYPSISRMDMAIAAWMEEQQMVQQQKKQQKKQAQEALAPVQGGSVHSPPKGRAARAQGAVRPPETPPESVSD